MGKVATEKQTFCSCCLKPFEKPKRLPCGHCVCAHRDNQNCAAQILSSQDRECPVTSCREQVPPSITNDINSLPDVQVDAMGHPLTTLEEKERVERQNTSSTAQVAAMSSEVSRGPQSSSLVEDINGNTFKKVLIVGKTGTGKSSLCNVVAGKAHDADLFPVSAEAQGCTGTTTFGNVFFNGIKETPVSLIDTVGFDDPERDTDATIISDLVIKLRTKCDHVNLFVIAVNGQEPRLDGSLIGMIRIFEGMFGAKFWSQAVIVFTRLRMDSGSIESRKRITKQTDADLAAKYIKSVQDKFPRGKGLKYHIIDSCRDTSNREEEEAFQKAMQELWKMVERAPPLNTEDVKKVETESRKLKREIEEKEKRLAEMEQQRRKEEERRQQELREMERQFSQQMETLKRKTEEDRDRMEKKHVSELAKLAAEREKVREMLEAKVEKLKQDMTNQLMKKQAEHDKLQKQFDDQSKKDKQALDDKLDRIQKQQEELEAKLVTEQNNSKLADQIEQLKLQQQKMEEQFKREREEQEAKLNAKQEQIKKQEREVEEKFERQKAEERKKLEARVAEAEEKLRQQQSVAAAKALAEQRQKEELANQAQWKKTAETMLRGSEGKGTQKTAEEIINALMNADPKSSWFIYVYDKNADYSIKCKDGVGETAEWKMNKTEYPYNMHIYTVPNSDYNRRDATDEEREKAESVMKSVLSDMESVVGMTSQKMRDELITRLGRSGLKWMYVGVGTEGGCWCDYCILSRIVYTRGSIYAIYIYLGD